MTFHTPEGWREVTFDYVASCIAAGWYQKLSLEVDGFVNAWAGRRHIAWITLNEAGMCLHVLGRLPKDTPSHVELQRIKNEILLDDTFCVEVYPPEEAKPDHFSRIRRLWIVPPDIGIGDFIEIPPAADNQADSEAASSVADRGSMVEQSPLGVDPGGAPWRQRNEDKRPSIDFRREVRMDIKIEFEFEVACDTCHSNLDFSVIESINAFVKFGVVPCESCLGEAKAEGHSEGYVEGVADGQEE